MSWVCVRRVITFHGRVSCPLDVMASEACVGPGTAAACGGCGFNRRMHTNIPGLCAEEQYPLWSPSRGKFLGKPCACPCQHNDALTAMLRSTPRRPESGLNSGARPANTTQYEIRWLDTAPQSHWTQFQYISAGRGRV